jgi:very-short-patch-repair endonuclease
MCAPRERAVIDAWVESDRRDRLSVVLEAMRRSNLKGSAVLRELAKMPRVSGRRELIALLNEASDGIESFLEHRAHRTVLNTKDFRDLRRQVKFTALGNNYVVDTYHEASRTVIEFDGAAFHGTKEAKRRDNARDAALATLGLLTLRIGYDDVMSDPLRCREIIRRTVASRSRGNGLSATGP